MSNHVKLSIIMPCFNVGETIERAIESVIYQAVNFRYEIIIIDDCSNDNGPEIFKRYADRYEFVKVIRHETNMGNAMAFYDGLSKAQGDYYCVLDGDDYYTVQDKLQKQVDFLDADVKSEYAGVAHYFIIDLGDGMVNVPEQNTETEYNYVDFFTRNTGYYHTTVFMYRNIFRGNVPELFKSDVFRGDTVRTAFQLIYSNKKIKVLNFVGSAYVFTQLGIWSGINEKQQVRRQINLWNNMRDISATETEKRYYNMLVDIWEDKIKTATDNYCKFSGISIEAALIQVQQYAGRIAYRIDERDYIFNGVYFSEYADSLCATLGYVYRVYHQEYVQNNAEPNSLCIFIGLLNPQGGGIFRELNEIINMYPDKQVTLISATSGEHDELARELLSKYPNLRLIIAPEECPDRLGYLSKVYMEVLPSKAYYYTSHHDPFLMTLMQSGPCRNDVLFSFDHGYLLGISNPNIDCIIAKRPSDFDMLRRKFGEKVIYIPTWNELVEIPGDPHYQPFKGHDKLITACAAARFYKVDGKGSHVYLDMVLELLEHTHGRHIHMGPIPNEKLEYVRSYMREHDIPDDAFIHIPWADNPSVTALNNHVDIFLEPFPTVSYKLTLGMLSCGIPVFVHDDIRRINSVDFIYEGCMAWRTKEGFINKLTSLAAEELEDHSRRSLHYFNRWHSTDVVRPYLREDKSFPPSNSVSVADNTIHDIREYLSLIGCKVGNLYIRMDQPRLDNTPKQVTTVNTKSAEISTPYVPRNRVEFTGPWVCRKFRGFIRCYQEHGAKYTLLRIKVHLTCNERKATRKFGLWKRFKNLLKLILPPPIMAFNREIERIIALSEAVKLEIGILRSENKRLFKDKTKLLSDLVESNIEDTKQVFNNLNSQLAEMDQKQKTTQEGLGNINNTMMEVKAQTKLIHDSTGRIHYNIGSIYSSVPKRHLYNNESERRVIRGFIEYMGRADFEDKFLSLINGLGPDSRATVSKVLARQKRITYVKDLPIDIMTDAEAERIRYINQNMQDILKVSDNLYSYNNYLLPIKHFEISVFIDKYFIDTLRHPEWFNTKCIIDAGAFIGDSALILAPMTSGKVYAFEATTEYFEMMKQTLRINQLENVEPIHVALGASNGTVEINVASSSSSINVPTGTLQYKETVRMMILDDFVEENMIEVGLIKVDIEGYEREFLKGAERTIKKQRPTLLLSIYHNPVDFFEIKPEIEKWNLGYRFRIHKPIDYTISREVLLIAEVE
ncbi:FkbM family methyltransferase [Desulfoscipio sp. XC116]|uniref:FkbM family methyltransferase n=1 Tax=Desulfoscipio sp. XC116 TaxID=3144975 RepID=UPI00325B2927